MASSQVGGVWLASGFYGGVRLRPGLGLTWWWVIVVVGHGIGGTSYGASVLDFITTW